MSFEKVKKTILATENYVTTTPRVFVRSCRPNKKKKNELSGGLPSVRPESIETVETVVTPFTDCVLFDCSLRARIRRVLDSAGTGAAPGTSFRGADCFTRIFCAPNFKPRDSAERLNGTLAVCRSGLRGSSRACSTRARTETMRTCDYFSYSTSWFFFRLTKTAKFRYLPTDDRKHVLRETTATRSRHANAVYPSTWVKHRFEKFHNIFNSTGRSFRFNIRKKPKTVD